VVPVSAFRRACADVAVGAATPAQEAERMLRGYVLPPDLEAALGLALAELGPRLMVRSSATLEDVSGALMPGILDSVGDVEDGAALGDAVRQVWASLFREEAVAYLAHRARRPQEVEVAVLLQRQVAGRRAILYTGGEALGIGKGALCELERPGGDPESVVVGGDVDAEASASASEPAESSVARTALARLSALGRSADALLGGAADVELVLDGAGDWWVVQVRPQAVPFGAAVDQFVVGPLAAEDRGRSWRWDAVHNPEPLSTAQAGLVRMVDAALPESEVRQRLFGGYLFVAREGARSAPPSRSLEALETEVLPAIEALLTRLEASPSPSVHVALGLYVDFYRLYLELGRGLRAVRRRLLDQLLPVATGSAESLASRLLAGAPTITNERDQSLYDLGRVEDPRGVQDRLASLLERFGALAPSWDVGTPTYGEDPALLLQAARDLSGRDVTAPSVRLTRARLEADAAFVELKALAPAAAGEALGAALAQARRAVSLGELDDVYFARAQRGVRLSLLHAGGRLCQEGALDRADAVFDLPLELVEALEAGQGDPSLARSLATQARDERRRQGETPPPECIEAGRPIFAGAQLFAHAERILAGRGFGGRVRGRATHDHPGPAAPVLVVPTLLPAHSVLLPAARAVITDHGGLLDHGAALAREYGLTAVVGTHSATSVIREGTEVLVDGPRGRVYVL
jgi:pyruvate,water dikinase